MGREVGHHDVGAVGDAEFTAFVANGLKGRGGGDVDGAQHETRDGDHVERELQERFGRHLAVLLKLAAFAHEVGPHADHVDVELLEGADVAAEILKRLAGNADHDAGAHLVARLAQVAKHPEAVLKLLFVVAARAVEHFEEFRVRSFKTGQVAQVGGVAGSLRESAVGFNRLLAERERHADAVGKLL